MNALAAALLFWATCGACAQDYRLAVDGRWFVMQGGDTPNVNHHMGVRAQWYGVDFAKVGGPSGRALSRRPKPDMIEDFYSWGAPVRSPVDGEVISVMNEFPDNPLGLRHERNPAGNHVVIKAGGDRYVLLAHFQHRSIVVRPGQRLRRGDPFGKCGNSGNSDFPHIHMHVQDSPVLNEGTGHKHGVCRHRRRVERQAVSQSGLAVDPGSVRVDAMTGRRVPPSHRIQEQDPECPARPRRLQCTDRSICCRKDPG